MYIGSLPDFVANPDPEIYGHGNYVVVDFETTQEEKGSPLISRNRIVLACWLDTKGNMHTEYKGEYELNELVEECNKADFVIAHNAQFELGWLKRCGLDLSTVVVWDTMLAEYVLNGNKLVLNNLSLAECLKRRQLQPKQDLVSKMIKAGVPTEDIPRSWLTSYCHRDVLAARELFLHQFDELVSKDLLPVLYQRCLVSPVLADISFNGMELDYEKVKAKYDTAALEHAAALRSLEYFCGSVNPGSPAQMRKFLFEDMGFAPAKDHYNKPIMTPKGDQYSVGAQVIEKLRAKTKKQKQFLALYKDFTKKKSDLTKYLRKFMQCCEEHDGLLQANFNQASTRTHRLSSTGIRYPIQFQNFNRDFKPLFKARAEGWLVGEADGSQLEFRTAVHLGRDRGGLADLRERVDVHSFTSQVLTEAGEPTDRQGAKPHTFKPLYGGTSGTEAQRAYYAAFRAKYVGIDNTQRQWIDTVLAEKSLRTEWGLVYHWPDCHVAPSGYVLFTTSICNYPVQAFATAEIIPLALVAAWHRIKSSGAEMFLVNTVHDSLIAELPRDEVRLWHRICRQALIDDVYDLIYKLYGIQLTVPLGCEVAIGTHWGDKRYTGLKYEAKEELYIEAARKEGMI